MLCVLEKQAMFKGMVLISPALEAGEAATPVKVTLLIRWHIIKAAPFHTFCEKEKKEKKRKKTVPLYKKVGKSMSLLYSHNYRINDIIKVQVAI